MLAPGGFVAGYLLGRALGYLLSGCPLSGPCRHAIPVLLGLPVAILGMGAGSTLAATRVSHWWEGIAVWIVGLLAMLMLVMLVGWLGSDSLAGQLLGLVWLVAAIGLAIATWPGPTSLKTTRS
ncbi:MAG: hypothetical protein AMS25_01605 [Gemmatimonas sp. SM23_52]|nr:MAG: hypothetical protein AMS25_01605 [Gemmatimonas sp. SM23_52]